MKDKIKKLTTKKSLALGGILIITIAIFLTVFEAQKQQETRQNAATFPINPNSKILPLSGSDLTIKNNIANKIKLFTFKNSSGIVFSNSNVTLKYWPDTNDFIAEISTTDINLAKTQVEDWLAKQGLNKAGICNLPLSYSLTPQVRHSLPAGTTFSPDPLSCQ